VFKPKSGKKRERKPNFKLKKVAFYQYLLDHPEGFYIYEIAKKLDVEWTTIYRLLLPYEEAEDLLINREPSVATSLMSQKRCRFTNQGLFKIEQKLHEEVLKQMRFK
jgi:hypothetical protein